MTERDDIRRPFHEAKDKLAKDLVGSAIVLNGDQMRQLYLFAADLVEQVRQHVNAECERLRRHP